jgi:hypothetical protein
MKKKIIKLQLNKQTITHLGKHITGGYGSAPKACTSAIDACPSAMVPGGCTGNATCVDQTTCYYQQTCADTCVNTCIGAGGCGATMMGFATCYPYGCSGPICVQPL